ncbi:major facilitator superfamily domain-containing protein [Echria macrotheca]|uniref:Major facilitator superfamily domain-containing protein n=1 Tax=Echria macrotheca TaxID=438768 RepID=A0AAJ0F2V9_9PEZI|nr:major facilitator superfamily domain-containing protein [Echria macrotheca]
MENRTSPPNTESTPAVPDASLPNPLSRDAEPSEPGNYRPRLSSFIRSKQENPVDEKGISGESDTDTERAEVATPDEKTPAEQPYHVFSRRKKWELVLIVSLAGLFSPLSSNIYFPALGAIAKATSTSIALVSLTVTVYMAVQGLAPSFWGPISDTRGRRVTFIGTLSVYLVANIGLACSRDFATLMVFRAIQAAGSAATISVGAGVIGDITTAKERGGFMGSFGGIRMLGQSIGPVIGGIITEYFGFHAIFWFLFILGSICLLSILLFLPETLRRIAGNGTIPLTGINRPFISGALSHHWHAPRGSPPLPPPKITAKTILAPLRFLGEKDVLATLSFGAAVYTIWSMVTSSTTALFQPRFGLTDLQTGLIFLPNGLACVLGSIITGRILDRDYKLMEARFVSSHQNTPETPPDHHNKNQLPVTRARLRSAWYLVIIFISAVAGYGFAIDSPHFAPLPEDNEKRGMVVPLMLQFAIAFTATAVFTQNSALMVDLYPGAGASATAVNNLVRCSVGAVGVAVVQFGIDGVGAGITFLLCALVVVGMVPLLVLVWVYGEAWRRRRLEREEKV